MNIFESTRKSLLSFLTSDSFWKVLVYDNVGQSIIAPVIRLGVLRQHGVTLNLTIDAVRHPVQDVASIYIIEPTITNLRRVAKDVQDRLYRSYQLVFITPINSPMIKEFAQYLLQANVPKDQIPQVITKMSDAYLAYVALSPKTFSLNNANAFQTLYATKHIEESKIETFMDQIAIGLISALRAIGLRPLIKFPSSIASPARAVGLRVQQKLAELESHHGNDFWGVQSNQSPSKQSKVALILVDRTFDFFVMIGHSWSYQSLIHDCLGITSNRVTLDTKDGPRKTYEVDHSDEFWKSHHGDDYPAAAMEVASLLEKFNQELASIGQQQYADEAALSKSIAKTLDSAPQIMSQKQSIDMHTNIAGYLMDEITRRNMDKFYETESSMLGIVANVSTSFADCQNLIKSSGDYHDKLRLLLCLHLTKAGTLGHEKIDLLANLVQQFSPDPAADPIPLELTYLRKYEGITSLKQEDVYKSLTASATNDATTALGLAAAWKSAVMDKSKTYLLKGVKHLISVKQEPKIVSLCEGLIRGSRTQKGQIAEQYTTVDTSGRSGISTERHSNKAIVFVIGGGSYVEAEALEKWAGQHHEQILYGSTDFLRPNQFLSQLQQS